MTTSNFNEANIQLFKSHIWQHYTAKHIETLQETINLYISIMAAEEMQYRIFSSDRHEDVEIRLKWVVDFRDTLSWFLKNSWQAK